MPKMSEFVAITSGRVKILSFIFKLKPFIRLTHTAFSTCGNSFFNDVARQ